MKKNVNTLGNTIDLLAQDMKKHSVRVTLPGETEERELFLILISAKVDMVKDLKKTFGKKLEKLYFEIAKKIYGTKEESYTYGVFVDNNNRMVFSFNLLFADYDEKKKKIVYKDPGKFLTDQLTKSLNEDTNEAEKIVQIETGKKKIPEIPKFGTFPRYNRCTGGKISYSLSEPLADAI